MRGAEVEERGMWLIAREGRRRERDRESEAHKKRREEGRKKEGRNERRKERWNEGKEGGRKE